MLHQTLSHLIFERKVKKTDFAAYLDVSRSTLNAYLSGSWAIPSDKIEKAAAYFNVSPGYLFSGSEKDKSVWEVLKSQQKQIEKLNKKIDLIANSLQMKNM